ncbi:hypothetical protein [Nocardioides iriomotensis]|uniref:Uncharacterized protein n=1 Tax=Nocardioides iriomotensis TaxID=715784 RepID=A0A4V1Z145_9ACTN|nr:hypothetical protein [Nocardioides iriomotensis]RYU09626.1 hypothetical protein ETU37_21585 [Nocardioides iriomotensis]
MTDEERPPADAVGSLAEEAAKLLGALGGWASDGAGDAASGAAGLLHDLNEHVATGGAECRYCPLCQVISAVRDTSPEVKQHLATATTSLLHAATGVLQSRAGKGGDAAAPEPVRKIDLEDADDDTEWED